MRACSEAPASPGRRRLLRALSLLPAVAWLGRPLPAPASPPRLAVTLHGAAGPRRLDAEVARSRAERGRGLMGRDRLAEGAGMLFLYPARQPARNGFWMYRTRIPLDIAFIDAEGRIVDIRRMTPCRAERAADCPVTRPDAPYRAALEVNAGYFAAHDIAIGDCVSWPGDGAECGAR
ncbi:DUF192 domain-containing protein [Halomonas koreensis]|uniref:DUF192 domain-containing protein n=1 Tax=Halomonas koreensis TaxID=245385 RepID=A0ABU1FXQ7_9GAMM|nr:DUF192 domain-containing protein [Halomonas koreensis]MDR5865468.1 DUF192 domain-containing protein [Halomonas koreensis]